jgi:L-threonylcarbamoyladenylate synthase
MTWEGESVAITVSLNDLTDSLSQSTNLASEIVDSLQNGDVSVFPFLDRYIFLADAFNHDSVRKIQFLRDTPHGTSLQVFVSSIGMAGGITQKLSSEAVTIAEKFWPGPLTIFAKPHLMLNWNLGDDGALNQFALRIPEREYLREVISKVGPMVVANANYLGKGAIRNISDLDIRDSDVAFIVDGGVLENGEKISTVIADHTDDGLEIEYIREGAISFEEIKKSLTSGTQ